MTINNPTVRVEIMFVDEDEEDKPLTAGLAVPGPQHVPSSSTDARIELLFANPKSFACEIHGVEFDVDAGSAVPLSVAIGPPGAVIPMLAESGTQAHVDMVFQTVTGGTSAAGIIRLLARRAA